MIGSLLQPTKTRSRQQRRTKLLKLVCGAVAPLPLVLMSLSAFANDQGSDSDGQISRLIRASARIIVSPNSDARPDVPARERENESQSPVKNLRQNKRSFASLITVQPPEELNAPVAEREPAQDRAAPDVATPPNVIAPIVEAPVVEAPVEEAPIEEAPIVEVAPIVEEIPSVKEVTPGEEVAPLPQHMPIPAASEPIAESLPPMLESAPTDADTPPIPQPALETEPQLDTQPELETQPERESGTDTGYSLRSNLRQVEPEFIAPEPPPQPNYELPPANDHLIETDIVNLLPESPTVNPLPSPNATRRSLDIRPRSIDPENPEVVDLALRPEDTSGLAQSPQHAHLIQLHRSAIVMKDLWSGASFCHHPLYFEDPKLERYGTIPGCLDRFPSWHSGLHFAYKAGTLPIAMALDRPMTCVRSGCYVPPIKRVFR